MSQMASAEVETYMEEARIMVLQLMGYLASYYRAFHLADRPLPTQTARDDQLNDLEG